VRLPSLWWLGPLHIGLNLFSRSCCSSVHVVFSFLPHRTLITIQWLSYSSICDFHGFLSGLSNSPQTVLKIFLFRMWNICMVLYQFAISVGFFFFWVCSFLYCLGPFWLLLPQATSLLMYLSWIALEYSLFSLGTLCWLSFVSRKTTYLVLYVGSHSLCHIWRVLQYMLFFWGENSYVRFFLYHSLSSYFSEWNCPII